MPSVSLSSLIGGGGGQIKLAPDLTFPSSLLSGQPFSRVSIDPSGGLTTALSLTGKFLIDWLFFQNITAENITVKLTVDGAVIWNDTFANPSTNLNLLGSVTAFNTGFICESSLLLEMQTATDTSVELAYLVRPIL